MTSPGTSVRLKLRGASKDDIARASASREDARTRCCSPQARALSGGSANASRSGGRWCGIRRCSCSDEPLSNLDAKLRVADARGDRALHRRSATTMSTSRTTRSRR
jgi:ABC-type sugar transport system ATPase subunit